jgi:hypothetical protein
MAHGASSEGLDDLRSVGAIVWLDLAVEGWWRVKEEGEVGAFGWGVSATSRRRLGIELIETRQVLLVEHSPTPASEKTRRALTSSSHLIRKPPLSFSQSLNMVWRSRVLSLDGGQLKLPRNTVSLPRIPSSR